MSKCLSNESDIRHDLEASPLQPEHNRKQELVGRGATTVQAAIRDGRTRSVLANKEIRVPCEYIWSAV
jgi:hypothetical protein